MLINPAIDPHVGLRAYLGAQKNLHTGEPYELTEAHLREWEKLYVPRITPQRYLLIVETGDEVLDYRKAVARYAGARAGGGRRAATTACRASPSTCRASSSSPVQLLYEEDGELKVGAVLDRAPASFQVESPHGRRSKIKAANVLLSFERPPAAELLAAAEKFAAGLEVDFLWECSGAREFGFEELAREYVGREPTPVEAAGVLMKLHCGADVLLPPRQGPLPGGARGDAQARARRGGEEKARAGADRRLGRGAWRAASARRRSRALQDELLYAPGSQQARDQGAGAGVRARPGLTPAKLFERCGRLADSHDYHLKRFLHEFFPRRRGVSGARGAGAAR